MSFQSLRERVRSSLGYDSSDDEDTELNLATGRREKRRTRSPSPGAQARSHAAWLSQREQRDLEEERRAAEIESRRLQQETNIDDMIRLINEQTLFGIRYVSLDPNNPDTRFAVGMVVRTHGMTEDSLRLLQRSPFLFRIFTDRIRNSRAARLLCAAGSTAAECARFSGHLLSTGLRSVASAASSRFRRAITPSQRQQQQQQQQQLEMDDTLARQLHQPGADASEAVHRQQQQQLEMDDTLARQLHQPSLHQRASAAGPAPEHSQPPAPTPVPPHAQDEECSICMAGANYIDPVSSVNYGPLGYVETHSNGNIGHPNSFHQLCLRSCPGNKCPMCRAVGPVWGPNRPLGQGGGGGSRKPRSKSRSKSKSKSKTRRLRKSRNKSHNKPRKPRKSRRRIRSSSSRRK